MSVGIPSEEASGVVVVQEHRVWGMKEWAGESDEELVA
jgi:hypothetical protein